MEHTESDALPGLGERPIINIVGEKVALGPNHKGLREAFERWNNDFAVSLMAGDLIGPVTREQIDERYERASKEEPRRFVSFAIYEQATMRLIGIVELRHISGSTRTAEYGILIGEKDCWGKGYGTETTILILDYAFTVLGLHSILLATHAFNERAIRAYTRAGFRVIGRWRESMRLGDQLYDTVFMDCLSTEFHNPLRRVLDLP